MQGTYEHNGVQVRITQYNDLEIYDNETNIWQVMSMQSSAPNKRQKMSQEATTRHHLTFASLSIELIQRIMTWTDYIPITTTNWKELYGRLIDNGNQPVIQCFFPNIIITDDDIKRRNGAADHSFEVEQDVHLLLKNAENILVRVTNYDHIIFICRLLTKLCHLEVIDFDPDYCKWVMYESDIDSIYAKIRRIHVGSDIASITKLVNAKHIYIDVQEDDVLIAEVDDCDKILRNTNAELSVTLVDISSVDNKWLKDNTAVKHLQVRQPFSKVKEFVTSLDLKTFIAGSIEQEYSYVLDAFPNLQRIGTFVKDNIADIDHFMNRLKMAHRLRVIDTESFDLAVDIKQQLPHIELVRFSNWGMRDDHKHWKLVAEMIRFADICHNCTKPQIQIHDVRFSKEGGRRHTYCYV